MAKKSVKLYTDNVLEAFYNAIINNTLDKQTQRLFPVTFTEVKYKCESSL